MAGRAFGPRRRRCLERPGDGRGRAVGIGKGKRRVRVGIGSVQSIPGMDGPAVSSGRGARVVVNKANRGPARKDRKGSRIDRGQLQRRIWVGRHCVVGRACASATVGPIIQRSEGKRQAPSTLACTGDATQIQQHSRSIDSSTQTVASIDAGPTKRSVARVPRGQTHKRARKPKPRARPTREAQLSPSTQPFGLRRSLDRAREGL